MRRRRRAAHRRAPGPAYQGHGPAHAGIQGGRRRTRRHAHRRDLRHLQGAVHQGPALLQVSDGHDSERSRTGQQGDKAGRGKRIIFSLVAVSRDRRFTMATFADKTKEVKAGLTFRKYKDGDQEWPSFQSRIFTADETDKCPIYVHKTPPCQASCPSGEDIRGWLNIVRGIEKPSKDMNWQEYAFRRLTDANPFPSMMGRVCPAPCQTGCNRNVVEDYVGINAVEQFIGDNALANKFAFKPAERSTGKKVAIIGGGPAGLAAAYQLRRKGHAVTMFDDHDELGGMAKYGVPGYRLPRESLNGEINRIINMGVEVKLKTRVGVDVPLKEDRKRVV